MTPGQLFLVVDRSNAFAWYSRGLVVPAKVMVKYRPDALAGRASLPLVHAVGVPALAARARLPVALELDERVNVAEASRPAEDGQAGWARGSLSARHIAAVHVVSESAAQELAARAYRGFDASKLDIRVSPELFGGIDEPALFADADASVLTEVGEGSEAEAIDDHRLTRREAVAGAVALSGDEPLLREVIDTSGTDPIVDLVSLLTRRGWLSEPGDDLFVGTLLEEIHRQATNGAVVASTVVAELRAAPTLQGFPGLGVTLDRVEQITRGESEMQRFRGKGQRATKAMLLYLLRPEVDDIVTWNHDETGADEVVVMMSRLLSGFAARFGGLPEDMRSNVAGTDSLLDWVAEGLQPNDFQVPPPVDGEVLPDKVEETTPSTLRELRSEVRDGVVDRAVHVAQTMGWSECLLLSVVADGLDVKAQGRRVRTSFPVGAEVHWNIDPVAFAARLDESDEATVVSALEGKRPRRRAARPRSKKDTPDERP
jgi:hypothetical protein